MQLPAFVTRHRERSVILLLFAVISILFVSPLYQHLDYWGILDWDAFLFRNAVSRMSVIDYGQLPLWNPYSMGGIPHLAHPETNVFSLPFLIDLIFGIFIGVRISIVLHLFIGLAGTYFLARHFRLDRSPAVFSAFLYMLSSMYVSFLATGTTSIGLAIGYMPWVIFFFFKAFDDLRAALAAALMLTLMWLQGGTYNFFLILTFMGVYSIVAVIGKKWPLARTVAILTIIVLGAVLLSAVRFIPSLEFTLQYPRELTIYSGFSLESFLYGLFGRDQTLAVILDKSRETGFLHGFTHDMDENGMYIGILPFMLFILGLALRLKKHLALAVCLVFFVWLGFGTRAEPLSLWTLLQELPPFSFMRTAERFRFVFMLCIALFGGIGLQALTDALQLRLPKAAWPKYLGTAVCALVLIDLFMVNAPVIKDGLTIPPLETPHSEHFIQIGGFPAYDRNGVVEQQQVDYPLFRTLGALYPALLSNAGTVYSPESIPAPANAIILTDPNYKGEIFLEGTTGSVSYASWALNRLSINVDAKSDGYVVINQNYYQGWRAEDGLAVEPRNGLLAVKVSPQIQHIELYYLPASFVAGAMISILSFCALLWLAKRLKPARYTEPARRGPQTA